MQAVPQAVLVGVKRGGLETFDDLTELSKHPGPYKIKEIEVQYNKEHILGTVFTYEAGDGKVVEGHNITKHKPFKTLFGNVEKKHFKIDDDDELAEISGYAALRINQLTFKTYKGKHETFGVQNGAHFQFGWEGHTFGAVSGGHGDNLDYFEVKINPLPEKRKHLKIIIVKG